jgi:hypothetical protein
MEDHHRVRIPSSQIVSLPGEKENALEVAAFTTVDLRENQRFKKLNRRLRLKQTSTLGPTTKSPL